MKYVFVTGGVVSGLGKGITAASIGRLLKNRGYKVSIQKLDPYINVDPGTMSPYEHGEVFVTDDGAETDLDLGHYERFIDEELTKNSSISTGQIYLNVINKERNGDYLGKTVQVIPHITNEIKEKIYSFDNTNTDILITEIGGTVGDIESLPFLEAIRQIGIEQKQENVIYIHLTLLPHIAGSNELKSKPTQHSVKELQSLGIKPDILVCRTEYRIPENLKEKIALFCNVRKESVVENLTTDTIYEVPLMLENEGMAVEICRHLHLEKCEPNNKEWEELIENIKKEKDAKVKIAVVGKYIKLEDSYLSIIESLKHAGFENNVVVEVKLIDAEYVTEQNVEKILCEYNGILIPGGFGNRGIEGKKASIKYARENNIPFLGICLGMQIAVIEFASNVIKINNANSSEFDDKTKNPVIHIMESQKEISSKGGTMRLGKYPCKIRKNTLAYKIYCSDSINERHRHRYEFNNNYKNIIEENGLICSGISPDGQLVEIIEYNKHPFFIGVQFHPEFKSRPNKPHPIFKEYINASKKISKKNK